MEEEEGNFDGLHDQPEELEETLSLCDLPLYGDHLNQEDGLVKDEPSFADGDDGDFFEFSSDEGLPLSSYGYRSLENIVFCGKIIPLYDGLPPSPRVEDSQNKPRAKKGEQKTTKRRKGFFSGWKKLFSRRSKPKSKSCPSKRSVERYDFAAGKVAMFAPPASTKRRWYLYMVGLSGLPKEVEWNEIKNGNRSKGGDRVVRRVGTRFGSAKERRGHVEPVVDFPVGCLPRV